MYEQGINYTDGIDEREAEFIAQKYLLAAGVTDAFISFPRIQENFLKPRHWIVTFQIKDFRRLDYQYLFLIDKKTGAVKYFGCEEKE